MLIDPDVCIRIYVILVAFYLTFATLSKSFYPCYLSKTRGNWCSWACKCKWNASFVCDNSKGTQNDIAAYDSCTLDVAVLIARQDATW